MPRKTPEDLDRGHLDAFARSFEYIFPGRDTVVLSLQDAGKVWERHKHLDRGRPKGAWDFASRSFIAFLYPSSDKGPPKAACSIRFETKPNDRDVNFARAFSKVFNEDYLRCADKLKTQELWRTLRSTQFLRAIARISGFDSIDTSSWIQTMEGSMTLRYEGNAMQHAVIFFRHPHRAFQKFGRNLVQLSGKISIQQALLGEKWIRSVVDRKRVALVGSKADHGGIVGLLSVSAIASETATDSIVPHESLRVLRSTLTSTDLALVASPGGDLYVLLGSGELFQKSQGRWRYINYASLYTELQTHLSKEVARAVLQAAIDISFDGRGALLCVLDRQGDISQVVADHRKKDSANAVLRTCLRGLRITDWQQSRLIQAAAATDGATILTTGGRVLDIACMVQPPTAEILKQNGFDALRTFPGARSTAAWNASVFGTSIKVSADGPVSVWRHGKEIARVG